MSGYFSETAAKPKSSMTIDALSVDGWSVTSSSWYSEVRRGWAVPCVPTSQ